MSINKLTSPLIIGGQQIYPQTSADQVIMSDGTPLENAGGGYSFVDRIYPVGSIYMSVNSTNPTNLFGGTWEQIKDTFLLSAGDNYEAGATGGETEHKLTTAEMPGHTHERGTMDITGTFGGRPHTSGNLTYGGALTAGAGDITGAFRLTTGGGSVSNYGVGESSTSSKDDLMDFEASRSWTGETSNAGGSTAHNNMPPYLAVYMWKRTA